MKEKNIGQSLYEFAFLVLAVKNICDSSELLNQPGWVDVLFIGSFFGLLIWKLALQSYSWFMLLFFAAFGLLCTYTCINGDYYYLIFTFMGIISMQNIELKSVVRKTSLLKMLLLILHVTAYVMISIIMPDQIEYTVRNGVTRSNFLFGHPNTFSMYVLWTTLEYIYARYEKLHIPQLLFFWFVNALTYCFTNSNTSIMVSTLTIFFFIMDKYGRYKFNLLKPISKYCFLACSVFFPAVVASYTLLSGFMLKIFQALDVFFTGRLLYGAYTYDVYGYSWFGRTIAFSSKTYWQDHWFDTIIFDNSYIWMFLIYGYFYLLFIAVAFICIAKRTTTVEKILVIGFTFYGVMEAYIINASICFPLLFIGKYFYLEWKERKEKRCSIVLRNG